MHARGMTEEVNYRELLTRLLIRRLLLREAALMWRLKEEARPVAQEHPFQALGA
jgi:hypothetical protein